MLYIRKNRKTLRILFLGITGVLVLTVMLDWILSSSCMAEGSLTGLGCEVCSFEVQGLRFQLGRCIWLGLDRPQPIVPWR